MSIPTSFPIAGATELEEILTGHTAIMSYSFSYIKIMCLRCAVQLGIPDAIHRHGNPASLSHLCLSLSIPNSKSRCLGILMRLLSSDGIFKSLINDSGEETFDLTLISRLLISSSPDSHNLSPMILLLSSHHLLDMYQHLYRWFRLPEKSTTPFEMEHGMKIWDLSAVQPEFNDLFNDAMRSDTLFAMDVLMRSGAGSIRGVGTMVDVGGGTGSMASALVDAFPGLKCTVLDLVHVFETAPKKDGVRFVGGDMLLDIPPGDAIFIKWVMHCWSDEECVKILKRCKEVIPSKDKGGKVILMEMVKGIGANSQTNIEAQALFDLHTMFVCGGMERNEGEWHKIFVDAGFSDYKIIPIDGLRSIIEIYP